MDFLWELTTFTLESNDFLFKDTFYLQIQGTAMGSAFASNFANVYIGKNIIY